MPTPTITIRIPDGTREALRLRAESAGLPLRTYILRALEAALAQTPMPLDQMAVRATTEGTFVPDEPAASPANVVPISAKVPVDERNVRHYAPGMGPAKTVLTAGYEVAEAECAHPKPWKVLSYMTRCEACGRRLR